MRAVGAAFVAAISFCAGSAHALTIDFESGSFPIQNGEYIGYYEQGDFIVRGRDAVTGESRGVELFLGVGGWRAWDQSGFDIRTQAFQFDLTSFEASLHGSTPLTIYARGYMTNDVQETLSFDVTSKTIKSFDVSFSRPLLAVLFYTSSSPNFAIVDTLVVTQTDSVIPEPASWALMVIGLGGAGALLRRKQREQWAV